MRECPDPGQLARMPIRALRCLPTVAVVAHSGKSLDGGLPELRRVLAAKGVDDPLWYEVPKSRKAPKAARRALAQGAELVFVWGGDGMVQRCIDALAGTEAVIAILPAGTANLLATNLQIPANLADGGAGRPLRRPPSAGHRIGERRALRGDGRRGLRRPDDQIGRPGNEGPLRPGRLSDHGDQESQRRPREGSHQGRRQALLQGPGLMRPGGKREQDSRRDRGLHRSAARRRAARTRRGHGPESRRLGSHAGAGRAQRCREIPFVETTCGKKFRIRFAQRFPYELDGGARPSVKKIRINVHPASIRICVPAAPEATPTRR